MANPKLERLLNLVAELIATDRPLPAQELRERLGAYPDDDESFKRTFERDKVDLRKIHIPIEMGTDPYTGDAGYYIDRDDYGLPDPELEPDERAALHLAAAAVRLDGADVTGGMRKLGGVGVAPGSVPAQMAVLPSDPHLGALLDAISAHRRLRFRHRGKDRTVDPFQLLVDRGHWYLRAFDLDAADLRSFRIDRIDGDITVGEAGSVTHVVDPADHPVELAEWALGDGPTVPVHVKVSAAKARVAVTMVGDAATVTEADDGSVILELPVRRPEGLRGFVLSFLGDAEIVDPPEYRRDLIEWLEALADSEAVG